MKKLNNKGFTLVELLAVIVVLAIVMGLAVVAITGVLDNARKATFVADAKQFLEGARNIINAEDMNSMLDGTSSTSNHRVGCVASGSTVNTSTTIKLNEIKLQQGGTKSPYGGTYNKDASEIYVTASGSGSDCTIKYSIYLTDGIYKIGNSGTGIEWDNLSTNNVEAAPTTNNNSGNTGN